MRCIRSRSKELSGCDCDFHRSHNNSWCVAQQACPAMNNHSRKGVFSNTMPVVVLCCLTNPLHSVDNATGTKSLEGSQTVDVVFFVTLMGAPGVCRSAMEAFPLNSEVLCSRESFLERLKVLQTKIIYVSAKTCPSLRRVVTRNKDLTITLLRKKKQHTISPEILTHQYAHFQDLLSLCNVMCRSFQSRKLVCVM